MVKGKAQAAATVRVPQSKDELRDMVAEYGKMMRDIERIEIDCEQALADVKKAHVEKAAPLAKASSDLFKGIQTYCEANRVALTSNNTIKTVDVGTGKFSWRTHPPKVTIRGKVEEVIERIKRAGPEFESFLRATFELDKVEILRNPNLATRIDGIKVASAGETFAVEPFAEEQLAEAAQ